MGTRTSAWRAATRGIDFRLFCFLFRVSRFFPLFFPPPPSLLSFHFRPHGWSIARQFCISSGAGYYLSVDTEKLVFPDSQWWTIDQPPRIVDATNRETSFHKHSLFFSLFSLHTRRGQVSLFFFFFFRLIFFERRFFFFKLNLFDSSRFRQFVFFFEIHVFDLFTSSKKFLIINSMMIIIYIYVCTILEG